MRVFIPLAGVCLVAGFCLAAPSENQSKQKEQAPAQSKQVVGSAGQKVSIDPKTHKIKDPDPEEIRALEAQQPAQAPVNLQPVRLPDGTLALDLQGQMLDTVVVKKNADGTLSFDCVKGGKEAEKAVKSGAIGSKPTKQEVLDEK